MNMSEVILFETSTDIAETTTCKVRRPLMVINTTSQSTENVCKCESFPVGFHPLIPLILLLIFFFFFFFCPLPISQRRNQVNFLEATELVGREKSFKASTLRASQPSGALRRDEVPFRSSICDLKDCPRPEIPQLLEMQIHRAHTICYGLTSLE